MKSLFLYRKLAGAPVSVRLLALLGLGLILQGCAGDFGGAYYGPSYGGYYGEYGYGGAPYYGYDPGYYGGFVVNNSRYPRYYGSHHFTGNFHAEHGAPVPGRGAGAAHAAGLSSGAHAPAPSGGGAHASAGGGHR